MEESDEISEETRIARTRVGCEPLRYFLSRESVLETRLRRVTPPLFFREYPQIRRRHEESAMQMRFGRLDARGLVTFTAAVCLAMAGCGKTPAPAASVTSAPPPTAASPAGSQKREPVRIDPAEAANSALAAAVKAALASDARLKSFAFDVRAANGEVGLYGTVDTKASRQKAEKIAAGVDGVKSVTNHLVLVSGS